MMQTLRPGRYEAWYVGGRVRDMVLGRIIHDWDIAASALPADRNIRWTALPKLSGKAPGDHLNRLLHFVLEHPDKNTGEFLLSFSRFWQ